MVSVIRTN
ncbi:unnamed protein product, partial [Allacma fusca]